MKKTTLLFAFFITSLLIKAQAPFLINYQAIARNAAGVELVNKTISVRFLIYQGNPTGQPPLMTDIHSAASNVTTNTFGLFTTTIGSGSIPAGSDSLTDLPWAAGGPMYLEVDIDTAGTGSTWLNMGTSQLVSVPYAITARYSMSGARGPAGLLQKGYTAGATAHWTGAAWVIDTNIYNDGIRVGIGGTTSPASTLDVNGKTTTTDLVVTNNINTSSATTNSINTGSLVANTIQMTSSSPAVGDILESADGFGTAHWVAPSGNGLWLPLGTGSNIINKNTGGSDVIIGQIKPPSGIGPQNLQVYDSTGNGAAFFQSTNPTSSAPTLKINTNNGDGLDINSNNTKPNIDVTQSGSGDAMDINAYGSGNGLNIFSQSANAIYVNAYATGMFINAASAGSGSNLLYIQNGSNGEDAYMITTPSGSQSPTLDAENFAMGGASKFVIDSSGNPYPAVSASTKGIGNAGNFSVNNTSSGADAVDISTNGTGGGLHVAAAGGAGITATSAAGYGIVSSTNTGIAAIYGTNNGTGYAGYFINNAASASPTLFISSANNGKGIEIQDNNQGNNKVLTSDPNGVGSWQNLPQVNTGFSVYSATPQSIVSGTNTTIMFNGLDFDDGSNYMTPLNAYKVPVAGVYEFQASVDFYMTVAPANSSAHIYLCKNGTPIKDVTAAAVVNIYQSYHISATLKLAAADLISIQVYQNTGVNESTYCNTSTYSTWFSGVRIY